MNEARLDEIWKQFGKVIRLSAIGVAYASGVKAHATAMHVQFSQDAGGADDYAPIQTYLVPAQQKINPVVGALERVQGISKTTLESYAAVSFASHNFQSGGNNAAPAISMNGAANGAVPKAPTPASKKSTPKIQAHFSGDG